MDRATFNDESLDVMNTTKNTFTIKIILSYLVLSALAVAVSYFLYTEYQIYSETSQNSSRAEKIIETGALINLVSEADSFSRLALLSNKEKDFATYDSITESLFNKVMEIKALASDTIQQFQLDSVSYLLGEKKKNIEQLRILKIANSRNTSLDDILAEFKDLGNTIGWITVDNFIKRPTRLNSKEYNVLKSYVDYLNKNSGVDTTTVPTITVDSMLAASRFIVQEAKRENSRMQYALRQKENELIQNDLTISGKLRKIITDLDTEITKTKNLEQESREASQARTKTILKAAGIIGIVVIILFSYLILTDFFKAERLKRSLKKAKTYSESLLKSREQLISAVSHDLKTPLQTITGYSDLLGNTEPSHKQKLYIEKIVSSSGFVTKLVDDLLDFSKLEAGKLVLEHIPFSLELLLRESAENYKRQYPNKAVALHIDISDKISGAIYKSDPLRLRQIINNLLGNAFKFTESGSVSIVARELAHQEDMPLVQLKIEDTGIGISAEKQGEIFMEFAQADDQIAPKFGGSGLGLTISKRLTALLNGSLEVQSVLNQGSTFTLTIPLEKTQTTIINSREKALDEAGSLSVVIVDDDLSIVALLTEIFTSVGIQNKAFHGFDALQKTSLEHIDFILTDIQMPKVSGFQLLENLQKGVVPSYHGQPIIAMTGDRTFTKSSYLKKGFAGILQKPFTKEDLGALLHNLFPDNFSEISNSGESTSTMNSSEIVDLSLLRSFMEDDVALQDNLAVFYSETKKNQTHLAKALENMEFETIQNTAHKMLTMFRQLQAKRVIPLLEGLEKITPENTSETKLKQISAGLNNEIARLLNVLKKAYH